MQLDVEAQWSQQLVQQNSWEFEWYEEVWDKQNDETRGVIMTWTSGCWTLQAGCGAMGGRSHLYVRALVGWTWLQLHRGGELCLTHCTVSIISETDNGVHL